MFINYLRSEFASQEIEIFLNLKMNEKSQKACAPMQSNICSKLLLNT